MDVAALSAAFVGAQTAKLQLAVAASMMRMNADADASIADLVQAASDNARKLAETSAGLGTSLDITV